MSDSPGGALADLSASLWPLLLSQGSWLAGLAVLVAAVAWVLRRRRPLLSNRMPWSSTSEIEPRQRRFLRLSFGLLWMVDGLLQAQRLMPAGFVPRMIAPQIAAGPGWLGGLTKPLATAWTRHPVAADAVTVWVQVGLGLLILVGLRGLFGRLVLWASLGWALLIWVAGEGVGGLLAPGATWLTGAPGAVLVYALAALLLLAPWEWWESGRVPRLARRTAGAWLLIGAVLQALPGERQWSAAGLSEPFVDGAGRAQPVLMSAPIMFARSLADAHPVVLNSALVICVAVVGAGLLAGRRGSVAAGAALCLLTWWLAQDFGVLGGLGTDPGTGLPLALLLLAGRQPSGAAPSRAEQAGAVARRFESSGRLKLPSVAGEPVRAGGIAFGAGALAVALALLGSLPGPADAASIASDSGGGLLPVPHRPAPAFALTDQAGRPVSMSALRSKAVLVTFLDPVCSDECPLIAAQLAAADRALGSQMHRFEIIAIDVNPFFHRVEDVAAFTTSHRLSDLPNWHFVTGSANALQDLLVAYDISVDVPAVGMVGHPEGIYFIAPGGTEVAYLGDGASPALTRGYTAAVRDEIQELLR